MQIVAEKRIGTNPSLKDVPLVPFIDELGWVWPDPPSTTEASIFAVYDENETVQFIGFSKEIRNSLRVMLSRQPAKCHSYKVYNMAELDQQQLMLMREKWFKELGFKPLGNDAESDAWMKPPMGGTDKQCTEMGEKMIAALRSRGVEEAFEVDTSKFEEGNVEVKPSTIINNDDRQHEMDKLAAMADSMVHCVCQHGDTEIGFNVIYTQKWPRNAGQMIDIIVSYNHKASPSPNTSQ